MRRRKFRPEISRHRLLSNWVVSRSHPKSPRLLRLRSVGKLRLLVVAGVLPLAVSVIALVGYQTAPTKPTNTTQAFIGSNKPDIQPTIASEGCGRQQISALASQVLVGRSDVPRLEGYVVVTKQDFGGLLALDYLCKTNKLEDVFRVQWHLIGKFWEVKKISRLPVR